MPAHVPIGVLLPTALKLCRARVGSEFRLNQYLYLADWYHALETGAQLSDLVWQRWHWGAWLPEIRHAAEELHEVALHYYQGEETIGVAFGLRPESLVDSLDAPARDALRQAADKITSMKYRELRHAVAKTLPMRRVAVGEIVEIEETAGLLRRKEEPSNSSFELM